MDVKVGGVSIWEIGGHVMGQRDLLKATRQRRWYISIIDDKKKLGEQLANQ
jgi:hypothetical protein